MISVWHESQHTVKSASRTTGIVPTVGTAATHLAIIDDTFVPWSVAFCAVLARSIYRDTSEMGKESLNVAASVHVEMRLGTTLSYGSKGTLITESARKSAVIVEFVTIHAIGNFTSCSILTTSRYKLIGPAGWHFSSNGTRSRGQLVPTGSRMGLSVLGEPLGDRLPMVDGLSPEALEG